MIVSHNMMALNAQRQYNIVNSAKLKSTEKLSSGYRINRASDDAAGLSISETMRRQIRGLERGTTNIQDGISLCQVADGALDHVNSILQRMNELSIQSANGTLTNEERFYIQEEVDILVDEINRIGAETTFNDIHIFDKSTIEQQVGAITQLVTSPSAECGKMAEAFSASNGKFYPCASIDFSNVKESNLQQLNNGYFSFVCPFGCDETFHISFKTDDTPSSALGLSSNTHSYVINIKNAISGADVVDAIFDVVSNNLPSSASNVQAQELSTLTGGVGVSHASALVKDGNSLKVLSNAPQVTEEAAKNYRDHLSGNDGDVDSSKLTSIMTPEPVFTLPIQCSSNVDDSMFVKTRVMNGEALSVDPLDVSTQDAAKRAISKIDYGMTYILELRGSLGAQQNRLEHAFDANSNTAENVTAAESRIRDTDMADEMVNLSIQNMLSQAGGAMLSQANQSQQGILSLLQ